ncbi:glycerophosphodiester phosphodiesterase [Parapedobacter sp. DT-150]|uniref:glycerophosphodiester phosphodiesterase n=1 Tax=Parapedobacter sp. DT-150 TaxID=3396162 RepID=UPI003F1CE6CD
MKAKFNCLNRAFLLLFMGALSSACAVGSKAVTKAGRPVVIGHRGMMQKYPENTLIGFEACVSKGMGIELDVRTSKDGELIILHDDDFDRTTNGGKVKPRELTLSKIKELDAGSWYDKSFANEKVPTFEEVLQLVKSKQRGNVPLAIDIKDIDTKGEIKLVHLLNRNGLLGHAFFFSQSRESSVRLKKLDPNVKIGQSIVGRSDLQKELNADLVDVFLIAFAPSNEEVSLLKRNNKDVVANTWGEMVNDSMKEYITSGIDGILVDYYVEEFRSYIDSISSLARTVGSEAMTKTDRPFAIGHRGMMQKYPENTLIGFEACVSKGMGIELDIRTSKDGELIILHDADFDRTTNGGKVKPRELTLSQIKELDAGSWYDKSFANEKVPTFAEVLQLVRKKQKGNVPILVHVKDIDRNGEIKLVNLLKENGLLGQAYFFGQSRESSIRLKKLDPNVKIGLIDLVKRSDLQKVLNAGVGDVFFIQFLPSKEEVALLRRNKKEIIVMTLYSGIPNENSPSVWKDYITAGIDGIFVDDVEEFHSYIDSLTR